MLKRHFEKSWVQNLTLLTLFSLVVYYFAFIFEFKYDFNWAIFTTEGQYGHMGHLMLDGLNTTITLTLYSAVIALTLGTLFGLARLSSFKPIYWFATCYIEIFRNTPLLVQLFFWNFAFPYAFPEDIRFQLYEMDFEFWVATIGCGIFTSAFMAEIIRAGIQSIPKGLLEASYSSGLNFTQTLRKIILPLSFREIIPPLGSEFLNNMKNTSLAMTIGVAEVCWSMQEILSLTYHSFESLIAATLIYLCLSLSIAAILNMVNVKLKIMPSGQEPLSRKIADIMFYPLELLGSSLEYVLWYFRKAPDASKTVSPLRRLMSISIKGLIQGSKGLFVIGLLFLLYKTAMAVAAFNFEVIWKNLYALLFWRFPNGDETEFFMGLGGLAGALLMAVISISGSFIIGLFVGMGRTARNRAIRLPFTLYLEFVRALPLILVIFWFYTVVLRMIFQV